MLRIHHFTTSPYSSYPILLLPNETTKESDIEIIDTPMKKGVSEASFYSKIGEVFGEHLYVSDSVKLKLPYSTKDNGFEPDIFMKFNSNGTHFKIDIEIDEPYDLLTKKPIHYTQFRNKRGSDNARNRLFLNYGFIVIRFCEEQIVCESDSCVYYLAQVLNSLGVETQIDVSKVSEKHLTRKKRWSEQEAILMAKMGYREEYLKRENNNY